MKKKGKDLKFISRIWMDGATLLPISDGTNRYLSNNDIMKDKKYKLIRLSTIYDTYIAHGECTFVVKLK